MMNETVKKVLTALEKNGMTPYYAENREEAVKIMLSLIDKGNIIGLGGSVTLNEIGGIDAVRTEDYILIDRYKPGLTPADTRKCFIDSMAADVFLSSSNAVTLNGELVNVDGNCNRVAPLMFGPKSVIIVAGKNKIVDSVESAFCRIKEIAAPKNCVRLGCKTPCAETGHCIALESENYSFSDGCNSPDRICRGFTVMGPQRQKGRIKVIIVGEDLGY